MRTVSPNAFLASIAIHGAIIGVVVFLTFFVTQKEAPPPVVFELVAGPPTAPDELVAPALGNSATPVQNPQTVKLDVPTPPPVQEKYEPPVTETVKTEQPPVPDEATQPVPKENPKADATAKPKPTRKPADPAKAITSELRRKERMSYKDYLKKHPIPKEVPPQTFSRASGSRIDAEGIAGGVVGGSVANKRGGGGGHAMTRQEQSELNTYIAMLINALREAHEPPPGVSDKLAVKITFDITAGGHILNPRITKSSGNADFDESALAAFRKVRSIGPTPDGKADTWTLTFRMLEQE